MSEDRSLPLPARTLAPALLGLYAAAAALAPKPVGTLIFLVPLIAVPFAWWTILKPERWLILFFAAALLLPPLPLGLGDSGPHPSVLLVAAGAAVGLWNLREWRVVYSPLTRAMTLFFLTLLASVAEAAFFSGVPVTLGSLARVLLFGISLYVFFFALQWQEGAAGFTQTRVLYAVATLSALFACVDFYFQFPAPAGFGPQFIWLRSGVYRRAQGLFYEASTLGNFCAFFLVMIAAAVLAPGKRSPFGRKWLLAGGVVFAAALVLSFSRGSLLNVLVAVAVLLWMRRPSVSIFRLLIITTTAAASGVVVLRALYPEFVQAYWMRVLYSVQYAFTATEGLLSGRLASWRTVAGFLAEHPWHAFFGIGYKTLPYSDYLGHTVITDNMYLSLLAETGIIGLGAMLWLSVEILRAGRRAALSQDPQRSFFGCWIYAFWAGQMVQMMSGDLLTYWRVLPIYFWVLANAIRREHSLS
ncbi:MAG: O-antigen ligase family protein [Bryobacteraceae bacterium]